jgi:hypothetical protein
VDRSPPNQPNSSPPEGSLGTDSFFSAERVIVFLPSPSHGCHGAGELHVLAADKTGSEFDEPPPFLLDISASLPEGALRFVLIHVSRAPMHLGCHRRSDVAVDLSSLYKTTERTAWEP